MRSWPVREHAEAGIFVFTISIKSGISLTYTFSSSMIGTIDWGDGSETEISSSTYGAKSHEYSARGTYFIVLVGKIYRLGFGSISTSSKGKALVSINTPFPPMPSDAMRPYYFPLYEMFANCENLVYVPTGLFANYVGDEVYFNRAVSMFLNCSSLVSIPYDLFKGIHFGGTGTDVRSMGGLFNGCSSLMTIPDEIFRNSELSFFTNARNLFANCSSITRVPEGLFDRLTNITDFMRVFYQCRALWTIPSGLFDCCTAVTTFEDAFMRCDLRAIPSGLFDNCPSVTSFESTFRENSNLLSIPDRLFAGKSLATTFYYCFEACSSLAHIGDGIFSGCAAATTFTGLFDSCYAVTVIPAGLFDDCVNARTFAYAFSNTSISSIDEDIFANCPLVTSFQGTFNQGSYSSQIVARLTEIPAGLFAHNPAVQNFSSTFERTNLNFIPLTLFDNCPNVTTFEFCFRDAHGTSQYPVPELWNQYSGVTSRGCFTRFNASNRADIPSGWGG